MMTNKDLKDENEGPEIPVTEISDKSVALSGGNFRDATSGTVDRKANLVSLPGTSEEAPDLSK
jgi:hypothetical protein